MDRVYTNLRSEIKRLIRRHEFYDYNGLMFLASDAKRTLSTLEEDETPSKKEEPFFPEFAYKPRDSNTGRSALKEQSTDAVMDTLAKVLI